jgi:hypothetical protein
MEDLFNMLGEEGFELVTLSFAEGTAVFEKDIYDRASQQGAHRHGGR